MVRVNVVLTKQIVEQLDVIARQEHKNRSEVLREAATAKIEEYRRTLAEKAIKERRQGAAAVQDRLREKIGDWDGTEQIRDWRDRLK
jgi:metal-responsive CopG/Arc/MetJ family transcriptional regulator